jgi:putative transposase
MRTAYKCRAYPDPEQAAILSRTFGCVRLVWNKALAARQAAYRTEGRTTSYRQTDAALTRWKADPELSFLNEVSSVPLQQTLRHQHRAFVNFFAGRAKPPRFKSRACRQVAHYTRSAFRFRDGRLHLAKTSAPLAFTWSWPEIDICALNPTMVIISREPDGRWYVTLAIEANVPDPLAATEREVGVDLGIKDFAVTSDGERIGNPRSLERKARQLARYQRRMARKQPGSNNRKKAGRRVACAHRKVRNARNDFLHRTSTRLVREYGAIAIENLNVSGMIRNRRLARVIADCGWRRFRSMLAYKAERYGRRLMVVDRYYPSSKTCSTCGYLLAELKLSVRAWTCPACGARHDRDINAAKNILAAGRAVAACGADVRRQGDSLPQSAPKQETHSARSGIPLRN